MAETRRPAIKVVAYACIVCGRSVVGTQSRPRRYCSEPCARRARQEGRMRRGRRQARREESDPGEDRGGA